MYLFKNLTYLGFIGVIWMTLGQTTFAQPITPPIKYHLQGVSGPLATGIEARLSDMTLHHSTNAFQEQLAQAKQIIQEGLEAYGYFCYHLTSTVEPTSNGYKVTYTISKGPQFLITTLNIQLSGEGKTDPVLNQKIKALALKQGQAMTTENYQAIKRELLKFVIARGYLDATWITHRIEIDRHHHTTTITLLVKTGSLYKVGTIQFSDSPLPTSLLKGYLTFQENDPYRLKEILQSQILLRNSGYFQQVLIETPQDYSQHTLPLQISLTPLAKHYTVLGMGFRTDLGLRAKIEYHARYLNSQGHQLSSIAHVSPNHLHYIGLYKIPGSSPRTHQHHLQLEYTGHHQNPRTKGHGNKLMHYLPSDFAFDNTTMLFRYLWVQPTRCWTPFLAFHYETFQPDHEKTNPYRSVLTGIYMRKTKTDWFQAPHNYDLKMQAQVTNNPFYLLRLECEGVYWGDISQWVPTTYLILRGRFGHLLTQSLHNTPPSLRFHAGGHQFPRGHQEYQVNQQILGGGIEIRKHLRGLFYFNPFCEMYYDRSLPTETVKGSAGAGICLWYPHIGQLEISLLFRTNPDASQSRLGMLAKIGTDMN